MKRAAECRRCKEPLAGKRKDAVFCSDMCRVESSKETRRCKSCGLGHATATPASPICVPCRVFDMIKTEKAEIGHVVAWLSDKRVCFYCGEYGDEIEHVVPRRVLLPTWTVLSCTECNRMAGGEMFASVFEKLLFIREKRAKKYRKLLSMPEWDDEELAELKGRLRKMVEDWKRARECVLAQTLWNPLELQ